LVINNLGTGLTLHFYFDIAKGPNRFLNTFTFTRMTPKIKTISNLPSIIKPEEFILWYIWRSLGYRLAEVGLCSAGNICRPATRSTFANVPTSVKEGTGATAEMVLTGASGRPSGQSRKVHILSNFVFIQKSFFNIRNLWHPPVVSSCVFWDTYSHGHQN
jgi:hypothetical protein